MHKSWSVIRPIQSFLFKFQSMTACMQFFCFHTNYLNHCSLKFTKKLVKIGITIYLAQYLYIWCRIYISGAEFIYLYSRIYISGAGFIYLV